MKRSWRTGLALLFAATAWAGACATGGIVNDDPASDSDSDGDTDTGTGSDTDTGTGSDTDTGTGSDTDTGTGSDTDTGTGSDTGTDSVTDPECAGLPDVSQTTYNDGLGALTTALYLGQSFVPTISNITGVAVLLDEGTLALGPATFQLRTSTTGSSTGGAGCATSTSGGCGGCACESCVCALDSFCCDTTWDSVCVGECTTDCGYTCGATEQPSASVLATAAVDAALGSPGAYETYCAAFGSVSVSPGTRYWLVMVPPADVTSTDTAYWAVQYLSDAYAGGANVYSEDSGATWLDLATAGYGGDFAFGVYGD